MDRAARSSRPAYTNPRTSAFAGAASRGCTWARWGNTMSAMQPWRHARCAFFALLLFSPTGCAEQDLSIGWQDIGSQDASVGGDAGKFVIIWRDDFNTLDPGRWEVAEHTFEENYADFSMDNAVAEGGFLKLAVRVKPSGSSGKAYTAAEVRTWATFTCGKFLVRSRVAPGFGVASTFFAFHDFFQNRSEERRVGKECRSRWWT